MNTSEKLLKILMIRTVKITKDSPELGGSICHLVNVEFSEVKVGDYLTWWWKYESQSYNEYEHFGNFVRIVSKKTKKFIEFKDTAEETGTRIYSDYTSPDLVRLPDKVTILKPILLS